MLIRKTTGWLAGGMANTVRVILVIWLCHSACPVFCEDGAELTDILDGIEQKYHHGGFRTDFVQVSTLKAMDITDTASGHARFKYPGMMRWEYDKPEKQSIITDGKNLWIYRPDDNQVAIGGFPSLFGDGRGGGFLSDIDMLREKFVVSKQKSDGENYELKLVPKSQPPELSMIILNVSKQDFSVTGIITYNAYGDETRIELTNLDFSTPLDAEMFRFKIPENADIIQLD